MPTASITYAFLSSLGSWAAQTQTNTTLSYNSTTGNPAGSLQAATSGKSKTAVGLWGLINQTWAAIFGIPTNAIVTSVGVSGDGVQSKCTSYTTGASSTSGPLVIKDYASGTTIVTACNSRTITATDSSWVTTAANLSQSVASTYHAATNPISITLGVAPNTGNSNTAATTILQDQIVITINYTITGNVNATGVQGSTSPGQIKSTGGTAYTGASYKRSITIDYTKCGTVNSFSFPVVLSENRVYLRSTANGGHIKNANGYDIQFWMDSNLTTKMNWEIEYYNPATGQIIAWVRVPTLSATANTVFYMTYGDTTISTDQSSATKTWNYNFRGVWHMNGGTDITDSTGQRSGIAAGTGSIGTTSGVFGANAGDIVYTTTVPYLSITAYSPGNTNDWSLAGWGNLPSAAYNSECALFGLSTQYIVSSLACGSATPVWSLGGPGGAADPNPITYGVWHLITVTFKASTQTCTLYRDGVAVATTTTPGGAWPSFAFDQIGFNGADGTAELYLQELQMSSAALSSSWILATYNNQNSPSTFYTVQGLTTADGVQGTTAPGTVVATPIKIVQTCTAPVQFSTGSGTITLPSAVGVGNTVLIWIGMTGGSSSAALAPTASGVSFTQLAYDTGSSSWGVWAATITNGANSFTLSGNSGTAYEAIAIEVQGLSSSLATNGESGIDLYAYYSVNPGAITPTSTVPIILFSWLSESRPQDAVTAPTGYTTLFITGSNTNNTSLAYKMVFPVSGSYTGIWTISTNYNYSNSVLFGMNSPSYGTVVSNNALLFAGN